MKVLKAIDVGNKGQNLGNYLQKGAELSSKDAPCETNIDASQIDITELKQMVQQLKTTKAKYNGNDIYGYELIKEKNGQDLSENERAQFTNDVKYYSVSRRRFVNKDFLNSGIKGVSRSGFKCYISYDINNIVFNGLDIGNERFNLPYDYFK